MGLVRKVIDMGVLLAEVRACVLEFKRNFLCGHVAFPVRLFTAFFSNYIPP